jgi:hypothetical protein
MRPFSGVGLQIRGAAARKGGGCTEGAPVGSEVTRKARQAPGASGWALHSPHRSLGGSIRVAHQEVGP